MSPNDFSDPDQHDPSARVSRIIAYHVPPLLATPFALSLRKGLAAGIAAFLAERLPGLDWWVPLDWNLPFEKYGIVHNTLPAPPHPDTGQAMALKLFGHGAIDQDRCVVTLAAATYANVRFPGVGVTFYM